MLGDINGHLKKIEPSADKRVNMWCHTCHEGRPRPARSKTSSAWRTASREFPWRSSPYRELRERHYGKGGYNFGETSLNAFGQELLDLKDDDGALAGVASESDALPQSGNSGSLADGYMAAGKKSVAELLPSRPSSRPGEHRRCGEAPKLAEKPAGFATQPTCTESIEMDPPSTPSTGNVTGSPCWRVPIT